jgi:hypothetical protein
MKPAAALVTPEFRLLTHRVIWLLRSNASLYRQQ